MLDKVNDYVNMLIMKDIIIVLIVIAIPIFWMWIFSKLLDSKFDKLTLLWIWLIPIIVIIALLELLV